MLSALLSCLRLWVAVPHHPQIHLMAEAGAAGGIAAVRGLTGSSGTASRMRSRRKGRCRTRLAQIAQARKHFAEFGALAEGVNRGV